MIKLFTLSEDKEKVIIHIHDSIENKHRTVTCSNMHKAILYKRSR